MFLLLSDLHLSGEHRETKLEEEIGANEYGSSGGDRGHGYVADGGGDCGRLFC
ncbi:unnamed protein product [Brassica oleracea var. botrytis]